MVRLTTEQKQFYKDNGYIVLRNAVSASDLDKISEEFDKLFARKSRKTSGIYENGNVTDSPQTVKGIQDLQYHHAVFNRYIFNESLLDVVEDVLVSENIVLHHTFGCSTITRKAHPMHQDYHYFPHEKDSMTAALLHLDEADPKQGSLVVFPGSHKLGPLEDVGAKQGNYHFVDQMASAEDRPLTKQPLRPSQGLLLRGANPTREANITKRFES